MGAKYLFRPHSDRAFGPGPGTGAAPPQERGRYPGGDGIEPANLYRTLRTLLSQGLIEESDRRADPERDDERRRYFRITALGMDAARSEAARLERMLAAARSRNLLAESDSSR